MDYCYIMINNNYCLLCYLLSLLLLQLNIINSYESTMTLHVSSYK